MLHVYYISGYGSQDGIKFRQTIDYGTRTGIVKIPFVLFCFVYSSYVQFSIEIYPHLMIKVWL